MSDISIEEFEIKFWEDESLSKKNYKVIHHKKDAEFYKNKFHGKVDVELSERYKRDIFRLETGELFIFLNEYLKVGIIALNQDDWHFFKTRITSIKVDIDDPIFCITNYWGKENLMFFLSQFKGKLLPKYSNEDERLYKLNNGNYLLVDFTISMIDLSPDYSIYLYNSVDELKKIGLFQLLEERSEEIDDPNPF